TCRPRRSRVSRRCSRPAGGRSGASASSVRACRTKRETGSGRWVCCTPTRASTRCRKRCPTASACGRGGASCRHQPASARLPGKDRDEGPVMHRHLPPRPKQKGKRAKEEKLLSRLCLFPCCSSLERLSCTATFAETERPARTSLSLQAVDQPRH